MAAAGVMSLLERVKVDSGMLHMATDLAMLFCISVKKEGQKLVAAWDMGYSAHFWSCPRTILTLTLYYDRV